MILVVDDSVQLAGLLLAVLRGAGLAAESAGSLREALARLEGDSPYEVLVSDMRLPDGSGKELSRLARQKRPGLKVLLISGYDAGAPGMEFLLKPFGPDVFLARIRSLLE